MTEQKLSNVQYQQKVIHLQSEVKKYQERIKDYEDNYHYQLLKELKGREKTLEEKANHLYKENKILANHLARVEEENRKLKAEISKIVKEKQEMREGTSNSN